MQAEAAAVVTGASSAIARALLQRLCDQPHYRLHALSRQPTPADLPAVVVWHQTDYSDSAVASLCQQLSDEGLPLERLVIANGLLHADQLQPERALREITRDNMATVFAVNTFLPMQLLSALAPLLRRSLQPRIAVLSARVGSISDNQLGGWYSYRGSKAALNMMLRSAAIEFRRLNPKAKLLAFHPGTTDSPLSRPFQGRVAPEKLFTPEFVAERLWEVMESAESDGDLSYLDWAGEPIPW